MGSTPCPPNRGVQPSSLTPAAAPIGQCAFIWHIPYVPTGVYELGGFMMHDLLVDDVRLEWSSFAARSPMMPKAAALQGPMECSTLS